MIFYHKNERYVEKCRGSTQIPLPRQMKLNLKAPPYKWYVVHVGSTYDVTLYVDCTCTIPDPTQQNCYGYVKVNVGPRKFENQRYVI